jgi:D-sedoheptulose 7-phosphate isomerase
MTNGIGHNSPLGEVAAAHIANLRTFLDEIDLEQVNSVTEILRQARDRNATIFIAGNGGSAATASHWVNDLGKATKKSGRAPIRVMSLSDNTSWLSALANDEGYERAFSGQLENFARRDDVLIVLSASGNSPNLIKAVETARENDVVTIGLLGFDGGALKDMVEDFVLIASARGAYELVEDAHSAVCHAITRSLIEDRAE